MSEEIRPPKTLKERTNYSDRFLSVITKYGIVFGFIAFILAMLPFAWIIGFLVYFLMAFVITVFLTIITIGLIWISEARPFLDALWAPMQDTSTLLNILSNIMLYGTPFFVFPAIILEIVSLIIVIIKKGRAKRVVNIVFLIISLILSLVSMFMWFMAASSGGIVQGG